MACYTCQCLCVYRVCSYINRLFLFLPAHSLYSSNFRIIQDRSNIVKNAPGSNPQLQAGGLMPHPFGIHSESSLGLTTPHPLAYGIMHQPLGAMGRVAPNASNDLGPPIFMPCK